MPPPNRRSLTVLRDPPQEKNRQEATGSQGKSCDSCGNCPMKGSCNDVKPNAESIIISKPEMRPLDTVNSSPVSAVSTAEEPKQLPVPFVFNFNQPIRAFEGANSQVNSIQPPSPMIAPSSLDFTSALLSRNLREGAKVNGIYPIAQQFLDPNFLSPLSAPASDSTQRTVPQTEITKQEALTADPTIVSTLQVAPHSILDVAAIQLAPASLTKEPQRTETNFAGTSSNIHFPPNVISPVTEMQIHNTHSISNPVSDPIRFQTSAAHGPVAAPIPQLVLQSDFAVGFSSPVSVVSRTPREYIPTLESPHIRRLGFLPTSFFVNRIKEIVRAKEEEKSKEGAKPPELKKNTKVAPKEELKKASAVAKTVAVTSTELQKQANVTTKSLDTKTNVAQKVEAAKTTSIKITFVEDPQFAYAKRALAEFKLRLSGISPVFSGTGFFCSSMNPKIESKVSKFSLYYLLGLIGPKRSVRSRGAVSGLINRLLRKIFS